MAPWETLGTVAGLLVLFQGLSFWAIKWLLERSQRAIDLRFDALEQGNKQGREATWALERDFLRLRADLPNDYVRRDDWIRFSTVIDAKLDALRQAVDQIRQRFGKQEDDHERV